MPVTLPIEVYEAFEKGIGKEDTKVAVKPLEITIGDVTTSTWEKARVQISETNRRIDSLSDSVSRKIGDTNKRIDSVMKIQLWIMGLIAVQAVAVIIKLIFS